MPMKDVTNEFGAVVGTRLMTREEVMQEAATHREDEVMQYQINIDNFNEMILQIEAMPDRTEDQNKFLAEIRNRVGEEKREQFKANMVLSALKANLVK